MSLDYQGLLAELCHESEQLLQHLKPLTPWQWDLPTPAAGWSIKDQVTHLGFFDDATTLALTDPAEFRIQADAHIVGGMDFPDRIAAQHRILTGEKALEWFTASRRSLIDAFGDHQPKRRLYWYGPDMSVASSATARLMETWAHGQDIYDALRVEHPPSRGLRSIAHLGIATFAFSHRLHGVEVPDMTVRVELNSPDGQLWTWGPESATDRVRGSAEDFVLTVTQRRHWSETGLVVDGRVASHWLDVAQAFAGAPSRRLPRVLQ